MSALPIAPRRENQPARTLGVVATGSAVPATKQGANGRGRRRAHLYIVEPNFTDTSAEAVSTTPKRPASAVTPLPKTGEVLQPAAVGAAAPSRWKQIGVGFAAFVVMVGVGGSLGGLFAESETIPVGEVTTVDPGESLWTIAAQMEVPGQRVDQVVGQIMELNGLETSAVTVGQTLKLPALGK